MATITGESTTSRILLTISGDESVTYILQRARHDDRTWQTYTSAGFVVLPENETEETPEIVTISKGDFVDSYDLTDGLYEYRIYDSTKENPEWTDFIFTKWIKFGETNGIGYSFGNYSAPEGNWGTIVTPDDCRYTYLWGTDFKATNGVYFNDSQIQWFIDQAVAYMERELNITIKRRVIKSWDETENLKKTTKVTEGDYDDEESYYDFSYRKIQRYGMITTNQRPIIKVTRCDLINRSSEKKNLLNSIVLDRKKGLIKFTDRPYRPNSTMQGLSTSLGPYGSQTHNDHMFYAIDYEAGYKNSDEVPDDLREIIAKVAAISLLNVIGDGLMSGFSSSSLSMDGISESFSSTQSATSAYFGARIQVYKDDVKNYIQENKFKFGFIPIGAL